MFKRNWRFSMLNAIAAAASLSMIQPYVKKMAIEMGASDIQLGYLSSWPNLVSIVAVLGAAAAVARSKTKKRLIAAIFLFGRSAALGAAAVPWFPERYRIWVLIGFWILAVFPQQAGGSAQNSFLADVFPGGDRAKLFSARQARSTVAASIVGLVSGLLLDKVLPTPDGYQIMFLLSFIVALAEIFFFLQIKEPDTPVEEKEKPETAGLSLYLNVFRYRPFLLFLACSIPFHFTWQMAWPLFDRYQVTYMQANNTWMQLITLANSGGAFFAYPLWAKVAERYGNRFVLGISAMLLATAPALTAMATSVEWLAAINLFTGIGVAGVMLLVLNNLLDVSPAEGRPVYLAVHAALVAVTGTVAPMVGAFLMGHMDIRVGLALCSGLRLVSGGSFFFTHYLNRRGKGNLSCAENSSIPKPAR